MATNRDQIEHIEWYLRGLNNEKPWKRFSHSRKWLKKQMAKYMRRRNKLIEDDDVGYKTGRKPFSGYEY